MKVAAARIARDKGNSQIFLPEQTHGTRISGAQSNKTSVENIFEESHRDPAPMINRCCRTNATTIVGRNKTASRNTIDAAARIFTDLGRFAVLMSFMSYLQS